MKNAFSKNSANKNVVNMVPFVFIFCLATSFQNAQAATIDQTGVAGPVTLNASDMNFPGTPLPGYQFPWNLAFPVNVSGPASFDPGLNTGFLMTGNIYFNFTGDLQLSIIQRYPDQGVTSSDVNSPLSSPEPRSLWLFGGAICIVLAGASYKRSKKRRLTSRVNSSADQAAVLGSSAR